MLCLLQLAPSLRRQEETVTLYFSWLSKDPGFLKAIPHTHSIFVQIRGGEYHFWLPRDIFPAAKLSKEPPVHVLPSKKNRPLEQCTIHTSPQRNPAPPQGLPPHLVDVPDAAALSRHEEATVAGPQLALDAEEQHFQVPLLLKPEGFVWSLAAWPATLHLLSSLLWAVWGLT